MSAQPQRPITIEEYLDFEETSLEKHEFFRGEIFLMAGGNAAHSIIISNINASLNMQLRQRPCTVYTSDMKIKVERVKLYTYPDVAFVCGEPRYEDSKQRVLLNPTAIIEVLSESTEHYDRGKKFQYYRTIDSLQEYILVAHDDRHIDHYVRQSETFWLLSSIDSTNGTLTLPSLNCSLLIEDVYNKLPFNGTPE